MWWQRGWPALLAVWTISILHDKISGEILSPGVKKYRQIGGEVAGRNFGALKDANGQKIYGDDSESGSSAVRGAIDPLGMETVLVSRNSGNRINRKDKELREANDLRKTGFNFGLETEKLPEPEREIKGVESAINGVKLPPLRGVDGDKFIRKSTRLPSYGEELSFDKYEERTRVSGTFESREYKSLETGDEKGEFSIPGGGEKLEGESSRAKKRKIVVNNAENPGPGYSGEKMQGGNDSEDEAERKIGANEFSDFFTGAAAPSANDSKAGTNSTRNHKSDSYGENRSSSTSTRPQEATNGGKIQTEKSGFSINSKQHSNVSISGQIKEANLSKGSGANADEPSPDSQETMKCIGETKFNKEPAIGSSAVNYAGYIEAESSDSDADRDSVRKYKPGESYRGTDVTRDTRREGDSDIAVADQLAYSEAAEIREDAVREIGVSDADEIGLFPAPLPRSEKTRSLISRGKSIPTQSGFRGIGKNSKSWSSSGESLKTTPDITDVGRADLVKTDESLPGGKFEASKNRVKNTSEVIGSRDHAPRGTGKNGETLGFREGNEDPGVIETATAGYFLDNVKKTSKKEEDHTEMTVSLNTIATRVPAYFFQEKKERVKKHPGINLGNSSLEVNDPELSDGRNLPNENEGADSPSEIRSPKFLGNLSDADIEITRSRFEVRSHRAEQDANEFPFIAANPRPTKLGENLRNGYTVETGIDVDGKSGVDLSSDSPGDGRVIKSFKIIVQTSAELENEVNKDEDTRESYGDATRDPKINANSRSVRTGLTELGPQNGVTEGTSLTVNLFGREEKNASKLRGEKKIGVSWTTGKSETNLSDKFWGSKPKVVNLSARDISGHEFPTESHFEVEKKKNDRAKLLGKITARSEVVGGGQTSLKFNRRGKFPTQQSNDTKTTTIQKFLIARLSDKYLASKKKNKKNKRAMKSPGLKIIPLSEVENAIEKPVGEEVSTVYFLPDLEDGDKKARNVSSGEISIPGNKSEASITGGSILPPGEKTGASGKSSVPVKPREKNKTRLFLRSFTGPGEEAVPLKSSGRSEEAFKNNPRFDNFSEISARVKNRNSLFLGADTPTETYVGSDARKIANESNETYGNEGNESTSTRTIPKSFEQLTSDLIDQDTLSSFVEDLTSTETPSKTTLDIFEAITEGLNPPFSFNQTDSDNASRVSTALNQWPVKHSAVVEGDLVLGGLMMVHEREDSVTCGPVMPQGGVQALEAMLYTLDRLNQEPIIPGVKIGAHILDDCDKDTYGLEMAVDFIKGSISNIDGAEYHCNKTAVRKVISGVVGAASSVTSIQVANLLRLFRIPQVSFFSTSPELSNKQRFEYFSRTIPSDHYQVKAMVDIVRKMNWSYVSIIYEESNYGIKAFEELEELLAKYDICIAIKEKLVKDSGVAEETAYDYIVQKLLTKPRARGCIIFGSDQEVAGVMRAVRRCNATGSFSWIGSDGWSARGLVSDGNEPEVEGTLSVQPQANPVKGFEKYFLDLTVENNRRNPWFVEFWEDHFQCRYPNASWTPYNQKYTKPCTTQERLTKQNTAFEDQLQFVSDAVTAFAYAFRDMHEELCHGKPGLCDAMKPTKGTELLRYLRKVDFEGLSGDKFKFDKNGDGPARYNIIHFKQASPGKYKWVRVGEYMEGELRLNMSEIQFRLGHPLPPESVCSLPCEVGQAKKYVEGESCCWHCFNCTQYQVRHPLDETQCIPCPQGRVPDETHSNCRDIPEEFLRPESGWAIGAMSFSATGIMVTLFVGGVFLRHNDTPVVRASGRELSYVLLTGILLCYLVTFALVLRPNNIVCGIQRFGAGFCFTVVYAALLTKTNRISRIFNAGKQSAKRPSFISPRSQLIICSGLVGVQILINGVWMIIDPAEAMHHYPTREDNLLVCSSYIDASYMIAFSYPIILIVVCTVYAVLTRKIPEAFNESKHIGFTMYTTCVIWLAFVPLYFGTGNHVALRITSMSVTISLSASVTIACLFSPKLYIILIRPERNVRQSMMPVRYSTTKSSAVTGTNASSMMAAVTLTAATCDQNKAVKRHVTTTIDCSTQSEPDYEMEVKEDRVNGKTPINLITRSTQTHIPESESNSGRGGAAAANAKELVKDTTATHTGKQLNNMRIGNGPVSHKDGGL